MVLISQCGTSFSTTQGNSRTINVYLVGLVVTVENKTGSTIGVNVMSFRVRNGQ